MKINTSFEKFKKKYLNKKNQVVFRSKHCKQYFKVENLFRFLLAEKNSFIFESVEKGKNRGRYTIIGYNPDKIWDFKKNNLKIYYNSKVKSLKVNPLKYINDLTKNGITPDNRRSLLRRLLSAKPMIRILEAHNGLTGLIVENTHIEKNSIVALKRYFDDFMFTMPLYMIPKETFTNKQTKSMKLSKPTIMPWNSTPTWQEPTTR